MSVNEKLTAVADAIREKTGGTDALTLDGMAEAIAAIKAGGGANMAMGEVTLTSNTTVGNSPSTGYEIEHGLGETPNLVIFFFNDASLYRNCLRVFMLYPARESNYWPQWLALSATYKNMVADSGSTTPTACVSDVSASTARNEASFKVWGDKENAFMVAGYRYSWLAMKV